MNRIVLMHTDMPIIGYPNLVLVWIYAGLFVRKPFATLPFVRSTSTLHEDLT